MFRIHLILCGLLLLLCTFVQAQDPLQFRHLGVEEGLSNNQVNCIFKDSQGLMWFGTHAGLNRYDGYRMKHYFRGDREGMLPEDAIYDIAEDGRGYLWMRIRNDDYILYDRRKDRFITDYRSELQRLGISTDQIRLLHIDSRKDLWVSDGTMLFYYRFSDNTLRIFAQGGGPSGITRGEITAITNQGDYYYLLHRSGLVELLQLSNGEIIYRNDYLAERNAFAGEQLSLFVDSHEDVWVYSNSAHGLWRWNCAGKEWQHFSRESAFTSLSHNLIRGMVESRDGNIWIATDHGGLNIFLRQSEQVEQVSHHADIRTSLCSNSIVHIYCDDEGIIWLGSFKKGVSYYSPTFQKFPTYYLNDGRDQVHKFDINTIREDRQGCLWLGTDGNGLTRVDPATGQNRIYRQGAGPGGISGDVVVSLLHDSADRLWIGTFLDGVTCRQGERFTHFLPGDKPGDLTDNNVWALQEDPQGNIWVGTLNRGLQVYDPHRQVFEPFDPNGGEECIRDLYIRGRILYAGTVYGIDIIDTQTRRAEKLRGNRKGTQLFSDVFVNCLFHDSRGLLWIGGNQGLSVFDERTDSIYYLGRDHGLQDNIVRGMVEDDHKNMWILTSSGLTHLIVNTDPVHKDFAWTAYNYDSSDGLLGNFDGRSIFKRSNGQIVIGGSGGYHLVTPSRIVYNLYQPRVIFTGLRIGNQQIGIDSLYNGRVVLRHNLNEVRRLDLRYSDPVFMIDYSALDYAQPSKTQYAYRLEGHHSDWIYTTESRLTFTNLTPGKYVLEVKAANSDGLWNDHPETLLIVVHPPFWRSVYAYGLYCLLAVGGVWLLIRRTRRKNAEKLRVQRIEMEAERQHAMDEMKLRFFTNISHDFRTPLSLVITPIEKMIEEYRQTEVATRLSTVHRNAVQLLNLVNQLLDFRKLDVQRESLHLSHGDYVAFVREVADSFFVFAERKDIRLSVDDRPESLEMAFDKDKVRKILMNLLSNAFKYTPEGGSVEVRMEEVCREGDNGHQIRVSVCDTGIGIPDGDKPFVFDRFYQVAQPKLNYGSGIGLHIVHEFVCLHGGEVSVTDNEPQGTVFAFSIPIQVVDSLAEEKNLLPASPLPEEEQPEEEPVPATHSKPVLLVVEDNHDFREFLADSLREDYHILQAADGKEALTLLRREAVDIIVCDVMMPVMDGLELCSRVKKDIRLSHIPFIMLTARTTDEQKLKGLQEGADDYITKPFNLHILQLRIRKFLDWNRKNHEKFRSAVEVKPAEITISSLDEKLIEKALKIVEESMGNSEFSVEELSSQIGMSRGHLYKKLLSITGKTPIEFIRTMRLKRAMQLLEKSQMNVSEVAYEVGFNSPKIFTRYFKEEFHLSPSEYLRSQKNKEGRE